MTMIEIDNIINNIDNYNDEELLKIHNDVYKTLFESYRFIEADEFVILLIKKIKDINTKITLIKRYLMDPIRLYNLFKSLAFTLYFHMHIYSVVHVVQVKLLLQEFLRKH